MSSPQPLQRAFQWIGDKEQRTPLFILRDVRPFVCSKQGLVLLTLCDHHMSEGDGSIGQTRQRLSYEGASRAKRYLQHACENADLRADQNCKETPADPDR